MTTRSTPGSMANRKDVNLNQCLRSGLTWSNTTMDDTRSRSMASGCTRSTCGCAKTASCSTSCPHQRPTTARLPRAHTGPESSLREFCSNSVHLGGLFTAALSGGYFDADDSSPRMPMVPRRPTSTTRSAIRRAAPTRAAAATALWSQDFSTDASGLTALPTVRCVSNGRLVVTLRTRPAKPIGLSGTRDYSSPMAWCSAQSRAASSRRPVLLVGAQQYLVSQYGAIFSADRFWLASRRQLDGVLITYQPNTTWWRS
jgi:hypothetical protein